MPAFWAAAPDRPIRPWHDEGNGDLLLLGDGRLVHTPRTPRRQRVTVSAMNIEHFNDLLAMARAQREPQRLLMVFTTAECEPDATPEQRAAHAAGEGGVLRPLMCVDKDPAELQDFATLAAEARHAGPAWQLMFTAALAGRTTTSEIQRMLELLTKRIETGEFGGLLPFNPAGETVFIG
jgi:hypothetical protein